MIGSRRACMISLHFVHLRAAERGNYTISLRFPIRLKIENLGDLALGGKIKKI